MPTDLDRYKTERLNGDLERQLLENCEYVKYGFFGKLEVVSHQ